MPRARVRLQDLRAAIAAATGLATMLAPLIAVPTARAGDDGQGVGVEYSAPIQYQQLCGDNQNGTNVCTSVEHVSSSSTQAPLPEAYAYGTAHFADEDVQIVLEVDPLGPPERGETIHALPKEASAHIFHAINEQRIVS